MTEFDHRRSPAPARVHHYERDSPEFAEIAAHGVMRTSALVVDGRVMAAGGQPGGGT